MGPNLVRLIQVGQDLEKKATNSQHTIYIYRTGESSLDPQIMYEIFVLIKVSSLVFEH